MHNVFGFVKGLCRLFPQPTVPLYCDVLLPPPPPSIALCPLVHRAVVSIAFEYSTESPSGVTASAVLDGAYYRLV